MVQQVQVRSGPVSSTMVLVAHLAALCPLPSALWRFGLAAGLPLGYTEAGFSNAGLDTAAGAAYVVALSVLTEAAALLTLGLVRPWGEVFPNWLPVVGGRVVPRRATVLVASAGAVILIVVWTPFLLWWNMPHHDLTSTGSVVVGFLYLPLVAWGPLLAWATADYARRHRADDG